MNSSLITPAQVKGAQPAAEWEEDFPEVPEGMPRHKGDGRPKIWLPAGNGKHAYYTRASKFGAAAEDKYLLTLWMMRAVLFGASRDWSIVEMAAAVEAFEDKGETDEAKERNAKFRDELNALVAKAKDVTDTQRRARRGTALHVLAEQEDAGKSLPHVIGETRRALDAYHQLMRPFEILSAEQFVVDDEWCVGGSYDRLVTVKWPVEVKIPDPDRKGEFKVVAVIEPGDRLIVDLKSNRTDRYFGIGYGVQLRAYSRGRPYVHLDKVTPEDAGRRDWPDGRAPRQDWAVIPWVPIESPEEATLKWVNLAKGEYLGNLALALREANRESFLRDLFVDTKLDDLAELVAGEPDPAEALLRTIREADPELIGQLFDEHPTVWTDQHTEAAKRRMLVIQIEELLDVEGLDPLYEGNRDIWGPEHDAAAKAAYERLTGRG